ncbi:pyridoxamine 5'-phosphate oxidase family protein [Paenibacillus humicola]|uniref:pyridoxamine 5'-phosphate oxidase family protein n=1 Tax=Paenibacillus humicola TaxID=3110540 RepID=UPI00237BA3CF|nr:pyridoxamine 5'-phosphate oxidase family protein [Paenibacillus humicola]
MRRAEFAVDPETNPEELEAFLEEMSFGFIGMIDSEGNPAVTPLNFVYTGGTVYFHGSRIGKKMRSIAGNERVSFAAAKEYAVIPSYFTDPLLACPATSYFKSVRIDGRVRIVDDPQEKAEALGALMRKLQPEGGHKPIDASDPDYAPRLKGVAVLRLDAERISAKFKFGQNLSDTSRQAVTDGLAGRALPLDIETIELMRRYCPHAIGD